MQIEDGAQEHGFYFVCFSVCLVFPLQFRGLGDQAYLLAVAPRAGTSVQPQSGRHTGWGGGEGSGEY